MLKFTEASQARDRVAEIEKSLTQEQSGLVTLCGQLHELRSGVGRSLIAEFEAYVNTLAKTPKEFDRTFALYHHNLQQFDDAGQTFSEGLDQEIRSAATIGGATAGLGAAAGAATAFGAPTAAIAVATTFGTASTGTAISALSGAAATKAALAWLGGGAIAAGGGGVAAGNALLALAGPVGWALAGSTLVAGLGWAGYKNRATIEEADAIFKELSEAKALVQKNTMEVSGLYGLTTSHTHSLRQMFGAFVEDAPKDCQLFNERQLSIFGAMHNNVLALSRLLKLKPGEVADLTAPVEDSELTEAAPAQHPSSDAGRITFPQLLPDLFGGRPEESAEKSESKSEDATPEDSNLPFPGKGWPYSSASSDQDVDAALAAPEQPVGSLFTGLAALAGGQGAGGSGPAEAPLTPKKV